MTDSTDDVDWYEGPEDQDEHPQGGHHPMSLLDTLINTATPSPPKVIAYGQPGVGKTTFAASAGALIIDCENGAGAIPGRTPYLRTWDEMRAWLVEIINDESANPPAVAIDTIDWMIQRICEKVLDLDPKKPAVEIINTMGSSHGGYFKAREVVTNIVYRDLLPMLNAITTKGIAVLLLAHAHNTKITSPEGVETRMASPDIPEWIAPPFIEWADAVLYAKKDSANGERSLITEATNVIVAKNRYRLPPSLPLNWQAFEQAMNQNTSHNTGDTDNG